MTSSCNDVRNGSERQSQCRNNLEFQATKANSKPHNNGEHNVGDGAEVRVLELLQDVVKLGTGGAALQAERDLNEDEKEGHDPSNDRPNNMETQNAKDDQADNGDKTAPLAVEGEVS